MKKSFTILSVLAVILTGALAPVDIAEGAVEKGPYLIYEGTNTEMTVLWQLDGTEGCTIEWGETVSYVSSDTTAEYGGDHQHAYTITGLTPGVMYYYQVVGIGSGSFTAAPANDATDVKFLVYGDTRSYPDDHDAVCAQMTTTYTNDPAYQTITLHAADWVNSGDNENDWTFQFFDPLRTNSNAFQADMPLNGCKGNHEQSGNLYYKYFPYPYVNAFYWSFDYGPVHIAVVDQYPWNSTQRNWLENDLSSSTKEWKIILLHEPGWSAGGGHGNRGDVQTDIQPMCLAYGVDFVFGGHNHYYARCDVDGVQHITAGGGGAPLRTPEMSYPNLVIAESVLHFCELDIQGGQLTYVARRENGSVIETVVVSHESNPPMPDPATFESGPAAVSSVEITMTATTGVDATEPVEYYFDEISGNPGGDDSGWTTNRVYNDMGLSPDTQYTYTVQMRDAIGNTGTASSEASATTPPAEGDPPTPSPATFASAPAAISDTEIAMTATTGSDATEPVEYYFAETSDNPGGDDSGWTTNTVYTDSGLTQSTEYTYTVQMRDALGNTGITSSPASATTDETPPVDDTANNDVSVKGTVSGGYTDTQSSDDAYQAITERESGGKPANRYSQLEHKWTINVTGGDVITFYVEAHKSVSTDGDDFVFAYSTDDSSYTNMVTVTKTNDDNSYQSYQLPGTTSGAVYILVKDTDRTAGNRSLDTIYINHIFIRSEGAGAPDVDPPTPDSTVWAVLPYATGSTSISMTADTADDPSGVEYYFTCTSGGGNDSGWQDGTVYTDTGLIPDTTYTYTVIARDKSAGQNTTGASSAESATTDPPSAPGQASDPNPSEDQTNVNKNTVILSWLADSSATSHDVYFGTDYTAVEDATTSSGVFVGNQATSSWDPPMLVRRTTYYWRIDEVNGEGTTTGEVWSFMTK